MSPGELSRSFVGCRSRPQLTPFSCAPLCAPLVRYPDDDDYQYLYETFPEVVSPMQGVDSDRFQVWMRVAALPKFRKLYATITDDISKGDVSV